MLFFFKCAAKITAKGLAVIIVMWMLTLSGFLRWQLHSERDVLVTAEGVKGVRVKLHADQTDVTGVHGLDADAWKEERQSISVQLHEAEGACASHKARKTSHASSCSSCQPAL